MLEFHALHPVLNQTPDLLPAWALLAIAIGFAGLAILLLFSKGKLR